MKKRILSITLALVLTISVVFVTHGQGYSLEEGRFYHGMTFAEFSQTQEYHSTISRIMQQGLTQEFATNYIKSLAFIENLAQDFATDAGQWEFPEYIGGIYINDDGVLVIQLTEGLNARSRDNAFATLSQYVDINNVLFGGVEFSYSELNNLLSHISSIMLTEYNLYHYHLENNNPNFQRIMSAAGVATDINRVTVWIWDYSPEGIERFRREVTDSPAIVFKPSEGHSIPFRPGRAESYLRMIELGIIDVRDFDPHLLMIVEWELGISIEIEDDYDNPFFPLPLPLPLPLQQQEQYYLDFSPFDIRLRTINAGQGLFRSANASGEHAGSNGFRARCLNTGQEGIVIAAHSFSHGARVYNSAGGFLGNVCNIRWENSGRHDAAFVPIQPGTNATNSLLNNMQLSTARALPVMGATVAFQGYSTLRSNSARLGNLGRITNPNHTTNGSTGFIITDLYAFTGDSGSPLYVHGSNATLGILRSGIFTGNLEGGRPLMRNITFTQANSFLNTHGLTRY
ncbi:MAG: S1 family peptidase [Defluviitaleaceae bacterium]|nr:S1 family peptidase [Defluviitaleaceae bacterium]